MSHFQVPGRLVAQPTSLLDWFQNLGLRPWFHQQSHEGIDPGRETQPRRPTLWEETFLREEEQDLESPHPHPYLSMAICLAQCRLQGEALCSSCFLPLVIQVKRNPSLENSAVAQLKRWRAEVCSMTWRVLSVI